MGFLDYNKCISIYYYKRSGNLMDSGPLHEDYDTKYKLNKDEGRLYIKLV